MTVWIAGLFAFAVFGLFVGFGVRRRNSFVERMQAFKENTYSSALDATTAESHDFVHRVLLPLVGHVTRGLGNRMSRLKASDMEQRLIVAGQPMGFTADQFMAFKVVVSALAAVGMWVLALAFSSAATDSFLMLACGAGIGWLAPDFWIKGLISKHQAAIQRELPGVLDILVVTTEAGLTFDAALQRITENTEGVLTDEIKKAVEDIRLNRKRADALRDMADRCGVDDLSIFVTSLIQAESLGAEGISDTLRVYSNSIRNKLRQRVEEKGSKSAILLLIPTVIFILPPLFIVVLGGALIDMSGSLF